MVDVRMPDGRIITNVPEGITQEELLRRLAIIDSQQAEPAIPSPILPAGVALSGGAGEFGPPGFGQAFRRGLGLQTLDNLLGLLRAPPRVARSSAGRQAAARGEDVFALVDTLVETARATDPALGPVVRQPPPGTPRRTTAEVPVSADGPVAAFRRNRAEQAAATERFEAEAPNATAAGEIAGDVLSLIGLRAPLARAGAFNRVASTRRAAGMAPGARRLLQRVGESDAVKFMARTAGRSLETGVEGAILAAIQEGDPLEVGAIAAGGQVVGSMLTPLVSTKGGALGLAATAAGYAAILQVAKQSTPGGRDRILESVETGFDKIIWGALAGVLAGLAGSGRVRGSFGGQLAQDLPLVADSLSAIPRAAVLSMLTDLVEGGEQARELEAVVQRLSRNPNFFPPKARQALERAMTEEEGDLGATIEGLKDRDPRFRRSLEKLMAVED